MLENGTISMDEALTLLENLSQSTTSTSTEQSEAPKKKETELATVEVKEENGSSEEKSRKESTSSEEQSTDDFLEDIRKDFSHVGDRFMQFMQTAVQKVKEFDFESPFGHTVFFQHTITKSAEGLEDIIVDIGNGKIAIFETEEQEVSANFSVKAYNSESEELAKESFLEKLLFVTDGEKLRLSSPMKMMQVNVELYVPKGKYNQLSARLMNGSFELRGAKVESIRVKTANGKIDVSDLIFQKAEFETANGAIELRELTGEVLEAETLNGRVYVDGELQRIDAQSLSGHVVVTTTNERAERIDAKSMSGSVEIYIPSTVALSGEIATNMGKLNLKLEDVNKTAEQEQILQRTIRFKKEVEGEGNTPLHIYGEAKTGSVLVCYHGISE